MTDPEPKSPVGNISEISGGALVQPTSENPLPAVVVSAFLAATVVALTALLVAAPPLRVGSFVAGPILLLVWLTAATWGQPRLMTRTLGPRLILNGIAGVMTAGLLLIFLGSLLVEPVVTDPTQAGAGEAVARLRPDAPLMVGGFLLLGAVVGVMSGVGGWFWRAPTSSAWPVPVRMILTTIAATLPLILLGGLVTSTESGMAVPDWPGSYGMNMVLFPLGLMANPRIFLEHSHRLFGMLVGLATIASALLATFTSEGRRAPGSARALAWACVPIVVVQGVLGGTRVTENSLGLAIMHGILAQVFFMLLGVTAAMLMPAWSARPETRRGVGRLAVIVLVLFVVQLAMGATFRHIGARGWHALVTHIALAFVLMVLAPILGARLGKAGDQAAGIPDPAPAAKRIGKGLMHATGLQFLLGWGALAGALMAKDRGPVPLHHQLAGADPVPLWEVVLTTAHQANGAVLLVLVGLAVVWTLRPRGAG